VVQVQSAASLEVTAARGETEQLQARLDASQSLVNQLQQQLSDATGQQAALRSSYQQLEATSDTGRAAKSDAR
jgi:chromosome segregation ATPase